VAVRPALWIGRRNDPPLRHVGDAARTTRGVDRSSRAPHDRVARVELDTARRRFGEAAVGQLATVTVQGRPHIVPCCFALVDGMIYSAVDGKPKSGRPLRRLANLAANGAFALLVDHYDDDWSRLWWVRVDGHGRIVDDGGERSEAIRLLTDKYAQYRAVPIPGPVVALEIEAWTSWP
jgi:PPOX class probable F420-dependent enzyme